MRARGGRWIGVLAALGACTPATATATVRALFVGINVYKNSTAPGSDIPNLAGPVNDVAAIKAVLRETKHLALDPLDPAEPIGTSCRGENDVSITLVDQCASQKDVTAALDQQIARSAPGDIVLFYYAGHGSTYEDQDTTQSNGRNDSIEPYDSGEPNVASQILDAELRVKIEGAMAHGVSVVTIFDSCHSGTATRALTALRVREIPPRKSVPLPPERLRALSSSVIIPPRADGVRPYRVHLAASSDYETANEYGEGAAAHGAFTQAFIAALRSAPDATYGDIMHKVEMRAEARTIQHPQIEGAYAATFLGPDPGNVRLYDAAPNEAGTVQIAGGSLSGVTVGSTFALYADMASAVAPGSTPLASGTIDSADASEAVLTLDRAPAAPLPASLQARELTHQFVPASLKVKLQLAHGDNPDIALAVLRKMDVVMIVDADPDMIVGSDAGEAVIRDGDGRIVERIGRVDDALFGDRIIAAVRVVARYRALLALANTPGQIGQPTVTGQCGDMPDAGICIAQDCAPPACPSLHRTRDGAPVFAPGDRFAITIHNPAASPRYLYLFDLEPTHYSVTPFTPPGSKDLFDAFTPVRFTGTAGEAGRAQLLLIATDKWINLAALAQDGLARDTDPLAQLLQAAQNGTRALNPPAVGHWIGTLASLCVVDPKHPLPEGASSCVSASSR